MTDDIREDDTLESGNIGRAHRRPQATGATGKTGLTGNTGDTGLIGVKGDKGDKGDSEKLRWWDLNRRGSPLLFVICIVVIVVVNFATISTVGNQIHNNSVAGCYRSSLDKVAYVNNFRVIADADAATASDPTTTKAQRKIRGDEAAKLNDGIEEVDTHIASRDSMLLSSPVDRRMVTRFAFSCQATNPKPSVLG